MWSRLRCRLASLRKGPAAGALFFLSSLGPSQADPPIRLRVIGGLSGVSQYEQLEKPFWERRVRELSQGRISAEIFASDRTGLTANDTLRLMRLGVVPFGTALLLQVNQPELNLADLPLLNPDMRALRSTVEAYRPRLEQILRQQFRSKLLAIYAYPAQVFFCTRPLNGLSDLVGRKVRTSSALQSEMVLALGAAPVILPFGDVVPAVRSGVVDCAITGTLSGNEIGLSDATGYIYPMVVSWGLSLFGASLTAWEGLPADLQTTLSQGLGKLEQDVWIAAERETAEGLACNTGGESCPNGHHRSHMKLVKVSRADDAKRRRLLIGSILPGAVLGCGARCIQYWNETMAPVTGITVTEN